MAQQGLQSTKGGERSSPPADLKAQGQKGELILGILPFYQFYPGLGPQVTIRALRYVLPFLLNGSTRRRSGRSRLKIGVAGSPSTFKWTDPTF